MAEHLRVQWPVDPDAGTKTVTGLAFADFQQHASRRGVEVLAEPVWTWVDADDWWGGSDGRLLLIGEAPVRPCHD